MADKIADELRARLRDEWLRKATSSFTCQECGIQANFIDEIIDALDAKEAGGWQPIETAPKDGRLMLLSCVGWPAAEVRGEPWPVKVGGFWEYRWNIFGASWQPTHWQPLPAPPPASSIRKIEMGDRVKTGSIWALVSKHAKSTHPAREEYRKLRAALAEHKGEFATYAIGERVEKYTGDYQLAGEVRAVFKTKAGKVRYVVEHDPGFLHIYGDANLRPVPSLPAGGANG